jgi:hypothetical protein
MKGSVTKTLPFFHENLSGGMPLSLGPQTDFNYLYGRQSERFGLLKALAFNSP